MSTSLAALKEQLAQVLRPETPTAGGLATGVHPLDGILPGHGVPRGRLTELLGARGSGKTTLLRSLVEQTAAHGLWVAYVDARRTLAPRDWVHGSLVARGVWMVRPRLVTAGAWCADVLLRSGAFALVILDGAPPLTRQIAVRLTRLAREADAAFVVAAEDAQRATMLSGALQLRVERVSHVRARPVAGARGSTGSTERAASLRGRSAGSRRSMMITVEKGGARRTVEVSYVVSVARRLCAYPEVPDRRGAARPRSRGAPAHPGATG